MTKNLRAYRISKGMTQASLAAAVGVQPNTVWRWESRQLQPSLDLARRVAEILGVSLDKLVEDPTPPPAGNRRGRQRAGTSASTP